MTETLKEQIAAEIQFIFQGKRPPSWSNGVKDMRLEQADSIINLMLAKVDSAGLTDETLHKIHNCDEVCESDCNICSGCSLIKQVAGFQLQAVKDILK